MCLSQAEGAFETWGMFLKINMENRFCSIVIVHQRIQAKEKNAAVCNGLGLKHKKTQSEVSYYLQSKS